MKSVYRRLWSGCIIVLLFANLLSAQPADNKAYRPLLLKNAARLGISPADVDAAVITNAYTDPATQITYIYLQQAYQQIKVYNTIITAAFRNGSLLYHSGFFVNNIAAIAGSSIPVKTHTDAVKSAAQHLQLNDAAPFETVNDLFTAEKKYTVAASGIARRNIEITLVWTASGDKQQVALTWNVNVDVLGRDDWWNVRINALTGAYVEKDNWTVNELLPDTDVKEARALPANNSLPLADLIKPQISTITKKQSATPPIVLQAPPPNVSSATYRVVPYPVESPIYGPFSNEVNPWLMAGAGNNAITNGWHFDGTTNYNITRGNNVFAFLDRRANNISDASINWPDTSATAAPTLSFIHNLNTAEQPFKNIENKKAALDNLFYWNNLMHDVFYQYGFNELSGNFQADNIGRGGLGNDYVQANAQDSAGYSNANFSTPTDGNSGRMQMYTFFRVPAFSITQPETIAGNNPARESNFSAPNKLAFTGPVTGQVIWYNDDVTGTIHTACSAAAYNAAALVGKIALIDASSCSYITKVKKAQTAGAIGVLLYASALFTPTGTDNSVTIPALSITTTVANSIITQLNMSSAVTVSLASGIYIDGDLDNGVICHEYGHGISNRLTAGPSNSGCLNNAEQGGEGWSDYFGLMMTTNWNTAAITDGPNLRPIGNYVTDQPVTGVGIRRYPYTTNMNVNPLTYANMATNTEVHATGEIWCAALWDMTWNIIQQQGAITGNLYNSSGTGGNIIAMNLVMTGLKLQPCEPGFLDARNAILAADSILYNYAHKCAIWNAFARRGMGYSANEGLPTSATDQTAATDLPAGIRITNPASQSVLVNAQTTITHTAVCQCAPATGYVVRDTIPAGFSYVSSAPAGTLSGNVLSFPATSFAALESKSFSLVLKAPGAGCAIDSVVNDNREASTAGGLVSSGTPAWSATTARSHTPAASWFGQEAITTSSSFLSSGSFAAAAAKNLSLLSFWHYYNTENGYDGGVVEYSVNGGSWADAGSLFMRNGYNGRMDPYSAIGGRRAFTGTNSFFTQAQLNLSSFGTNPVAFRFRMESDDAVAAEGWYVDDIIRANGCGGMVKTGIYNSANISQDTATLPVFVTPVIILPVQLLWFYASQVGGQVALDWKTASEINLWNFAVEWSKNGRDWATIYMVNAGNATTNSYHTLHTNPVVGVNYYRIRMNDADGKFTYSAVRVITMNENGKAMLVLVPNPVSTDVTLYLSRELKAVSISIYDAAGSLVRRIPVGTGVQQITISTVALATGMYTLQAAGTGQFVTRMLVQH